MSKQKETKRAPNSHPEAIREAGPAARGLALKASHAGQRAGGKLNSGTFHGVGCRRSSFPLPGLEEARGRRVLETTNTGGSWLRALCTGAQKGKPHDPCRDLTIQVLSFLKRRQGLSLDGSERPRPGKRFREIEDWGRRHKNVPGSIGNASHTCQPT